MYNEQLEQLIDAALVDGELTEKEKQVLFKKAQALGVDLDEFEIVLDARLVKFKKAEEEKAASSAPKSDKFGDVKKCPACGAIVQSYQGVCSECGYAFENLDANRSAQKFSELIDKVMLENNKLELESGMAPADLEMEKKQRIDNAIQNFPIPNSKADLIEFLTSLQPKIYSGPHAKAYYRKMQECVYKAQIMFPKDETMQALVTRFNKNQGSGFKRWWTGLTGTGKIIMEFVLIAIVFFIVLIIIDMQKL